MNDPNLLALPILYWRVFKVWKVLVSLLETGSKKKGKQPNNLNMYIQWSGSKLLTQSQKCRKSKKRGPWAASLAALLFLSVLWHTFLLIPFGGGLWVNMFLRILRRLKGVKLCDLGRRRPLSSTFYRRLVFVGIFRRFPAVHTLGLIAFVGRGISFQPLRCHTPAEWDWGPGTLNQKLLRRASDKSSARAGEHNYGRVSFHLNKINDTLLDDTLSRGLCKWSKFNIDFVTCWVVCLFFFVAAERRNKYPTLSWVVDSLMKLSMKQEKDVPARSHFANARRISVRSVRVYYRWRLFGR